MTTKMIELEIVRSKNYYDYIDKHGEDVNTCFICGKRIKNIDEAAYIQYTTDGYITNDMNDVENSQGCFPMGNDCAKKVAKAFK